MSEFVPHAAPVVVLLLLGTVLLIALSVLVFFYGALRRSKFCARLGARAAFSMLAGYFLLLAGVSLAKKTCRRVAGSTFAKSIATLLILSSLRKP